MNDKRIPLEQKIKQLRKGVIELAVLKILSEKEGYGYNIVETLTANDLLIAEGTIYPILSRLKKEGAITYRWEESTKGPPRKYYLLTKEGKELLVALLTEFRDFNKKIVKILGE